MNRNSIKNKINNETFITKNLKSGNTSVNASRNVSENVSKN
jgi:hypothetical protein